MYFDFYQESKRFEIELSECREMLKSVDGVALRQFVLVEIPVRLEVQVRLVITKS